ncbi:uncharacterized protein LOC110455467 [Mizuhopecten yessoensis]|uniref:Uncharacterized protein n=1 Tax=Mizuhopecten yessoensis TaxID=6573 RepID=A0A210QD32_MIZYE|nr:uncharacterized protein LOC110455467 [Mizuhopecten yessoensis]XP_021361298.1 uncharacterized protein LOC110455467 [Mizuhopecten yessoensis]XP_021361299.1 uncharacterized protein LOC110455467 [Mizuhopecten yessoensis]XP_021361300.1 uncharacterized protein LOC110455467 [Mizuhopecten yessoensis]XP_021361301.1 uncharacterized protein LOC110455467 [Mizuhopecten yessoensis]XP_021361302.1 uncharacterized protein LOC110455467 [Mizuhopecten yessoensis]OWF46635.1 hypothetical protein KP79_PYT10300 [
MKKPPASDNKENAHKPDTKSSGNDRKKSEASSPDSKRQCITEIVYKDVYLMDRTGGRFDKNLLANSLTAKLKQNIPGEFTTKTQLMHKLRRESLKDYVHLENLNKKYDSEMQVQTNRLDNESNLLLRRHDKMRKQSEYQRKNQEKIRSQIRNPSMKQPNAASSVFPQIKYFSQAHAASQPPDAATVEVHPSHQLENAAAFPSFSVDTHDPTNVKVFKYQGIFQPQNKYSSRRNSQRSSASGGILKRDMNTPEYEILTLSLEDGSESRASNKNRNDKKRKGLRVTWSGVEREFERGRVNHEDTVSNDNELRGDGGASTPSTTKSASSGYGLHYRQNKRNKIENIGIKWKLPQGSKQSTRAVKSATAAYATNSRSKNLMPVSGGLHQTGMSVTRTRWHVPSAPPLSSYDLYREWLHKLDKLKSPMEPKQFLREVPAMDQKMDSCSRGYTLPANISEQMNLSIYAESNVV